MRHIALALGFLTALSSQAASQQVVDEFVAGNSHARVELQPFLEKYRATLTSDAASTSLPDEGMGPIEKAALFVDAVEGELPITRWLYRYGQTTLEGSTGDPETLWFVDITRFNVGPAWRAATAEEHGEENIAAPGEFGIGPTVSWRLVFSPVMGMTADFVDAGRREWTDLQAENAKCFGEPCLSIDNLINGLGEWAPAERSPDIAKLPYEPKVAARLVNAAGFGHGFESVAGRHSQWSAPEKPERLANRPDPFIGGLIETGIGQDPADDIAMVNAGVNDHAIMDMWQRVIVRDGAGEHMSFTTPRPRQP